MADAAVVTAADIARLAGVTRGTVSNWRRRHPDFPAPVGGTDASPAYDRTEVEAWLASRGTLPELPPLERLWRAVTDTADGGDLGNVVSESVTSLQVLAVIGVVNQAGPAGPAPPGELLADEGDGGTAGPDDADDRLTEVLTDVAREVGATPALRGLIDRYADAAGISITPKPVADLMAGLAVTAGSTVLDPACGTGELLVAALDRGATRVRGQELDPDLQRLASSRLSTRLQPWHVEDNAERFEDEDGPPLAAYTVAGNSLLADRFPRLRADSVLCHPPFGSRDWGQEQLAGDPRWAYGIPPKAESELAWAQHALAHLRPGGRAVLLMPPAAASRPSGRRIRAELLRQGALRAVVAMPPSAVRPAHVAMHLWVLERPAGATPADPRVLLVDVSDRERVSQGSVGGAVRAEEEEADSGFPPSLAATVLNAWRVFTADDAVRERATRQKADAGPGSWQVMRAIDLLDEAVDLTPARHVAPAEPGLRPEQTSQRLRELRSRLRASLAEFEYLLQGEDWKFPEAAPHWHTVPVTDLVRARMVEYLRERRDEPVNVQPGDVLIPAWLDRAVSGTTGDGGTGELRATVAGVNDAGTRLGKHHSLLRPDPAQVDPWFIAGFATAPGSIRQASYGTSAIRIDARRLEVPLLPLDQQRRYGAAFRQLHDAERAAASVTGLTGELAALLAARLTDGTLLPRSPSDDEAGHDDEKEAAGEA
jgi:hypothetical protein